MRRWWHKFYARCGMTSLTDRRIYLFARQLTAFTRFGPLSTFNLQFFRINQVFGRYAETTGGNLLDFTTTTIPIRQWFITSRIFTTFAGITHGSQTVHGNGNRFMRFFTDGTVTHGTAFEAFYDGFNRFHFFNGNTAANREVKIQQTAKSYMVIIANIWRILFVELIIVFNTSPLQ